MKTLMLFRTADGRQFTTDCTTTPGDALDVRFDPLTARFVWRASCAGDIPSGMRRLRSIGRWAVEALRGPNGPPVDIEFMSGFEKDYQLVKIYDEVLGPPRPPTHEWPAGEQP